MLRRLLLPLALMGVFLAVAATGNAGTAKSAGLVGEATAQAAEHRPDVEHAVHQAIADLKKDGMIIETRRTRE